TIRNGAAWTELKLAIARNVTPLSDERNEYFGCMTVLPSLLTDIFLLASAYDHRSARDRAQYCERGRAAAHRGKTRINRWLMERVVRFPDLPCLRTSRRYLELLSAVRKGRSAAR